jgi:CPA2 family monovalent cation:H+ antiporter-2
LEGLNIGLDLLIVLVVAIAGGMLARLIHLPILLGYLAAGAAVGPNGFGLISEQGTIEAVANIGVILLLFTVGLEFSLKEIKNIGKVAVLGGLLQMLVTTLVIIGITRLFHFPIITAVFFGIIIAESSTAVILRLIIERGDLESRYARISSSLSIVQDLSCIPVIAVMPAIGGSESGMAMILPVLIALGKALGFLAVALALGWWVLPRIMDRIARMRSRELFLLFIVTLCLGTALGANLLGVSAAFGAFVAGMLISQSAYARQAMADIVPLRDTFSALFFASLGMFFSISFVVANWSDILTLVPILFILKIAIAGAIVWFFGSSFKTSFLAGLALLPVGEFSFIMAQVGWEENIFNEYYRSLIVALAVITMLISPVILSLGARFYTWLSQRSKLLAIVSHRTDPSFPPEQMEISRHAIICGYGSVGKQIAAVLDKYKFTYLVIELDPTTISNLRERGIPSIYGDASNPEILKHANLDKARVLICTIPEYVSTEMIVRNAKKINPRLDIVARVHRDQDAELLKGLGVSELVLPFFEGSLEMIRHSLQRFGMNGTEVQYILNNLRRDQLGEKEEEK